MKHTDAKYSMCKDYNTSSLTLNNKIMEIQN